jgi:hypothetical protein
MDAFAQKLRERGFDPQYQRDVAKKVAALSEGAKGIASKKRPNLRQTGMGSFDPETGARASKEQLGAVKQFQDYDAMREELAGYLAGNVYDRGKRPDMEQARKIVDDFARAQREQQYAAPATSTPESPVPATAPVPAAAPQDDIRSMIEATGNALSSEPVADEQPATAPMGNVSTEIGAPKAAPAAAPEISEDRMSALFRKTMGTAFDPKSKMDIGKMNQLREFVGGNSDLLNKSDTKIALDYYRTLK